MVSLQDQSGIFSSGDGSYGATEHFCFLWSRYSNVKNGFQICEIFLHRQFFLFFQNSHISITRI